MKFPRLKIEYEEEESYALGQVSAPLIVGYGMHWAWVYLFVFNGSMLFFPDAPQMQHILFPVSLAAFMCTFLCYSIFLQPARRLFSKRKARQRIRALAAVLVVVSMLLTTLGNFMPAARVACCVASGLFSGIGSCVLLMSHGVSFSACDLPSIAVSTAASLPISAALYAIGIALDVACHPLGAVLCIVLTVAEVVLLYVSSHKLVDPFDFFRFTAPVHIRPFALHICLPSFVFGFALGFIRTRATSTLGSGSAAVSGGVAVFLAAVLACLVLLAGMLTQRKAHNFEFHTLVPMAALLLATLVVPETLGGTYETFALFSAYLMLEACLWVMYADYAQRYRISAFLIFGLGRGMLAVGTFASYLISVDGAPLSNTLSSDISPLLAITLAGLVLGMACLPTDRDMQRTLKRAPAVQEPADARSAPQEEPAAADGAPTGQAQAGAQPAGATAPPSAESAQLQQRARAASEAGALDEVQHQAEEEEAEESEQHKQGRFKAKCYVVAERYLLSAKETEVLFLLAKGFKSASIQKALCISEGTVNTHKRHIYRKLDVHSQQALMDLVESEEVEWFEWDS